MPRWTFRLPLLLAVCILGCDPAPEDPLFAFGSLEAPDGTPVAGTLQVLRGGCSGHWCDPSMPGPGAPGAPPPEPEFAPFTEFTTEEDGTWMLEFTRFDATLYTQHGTLQRSFKIVAQPEPTLPPVEAVYNYQGTDVDLPPLRQWDAQASVELNPSGDAWEISTASAPPIPKQEMTRLNESLPFETHRTGAYGVAFLNAEAEAIWLHPAGETGALPLEALEDFAVAWKVLATHSGPWFAPTLLGGQTYSTVTQVFPTVELPSHTPRVAMSRGQPCTMLAYDLSPAEELNPCPFTDGSLEFVRNRPAEAVWTSRFVVTQRAAAHGPGSSSSRFFAG